MPHLPGTGALDPVGLPAGPVVPSAGMPDLEGSFHIPVVQAAPGPPWNTRSSPAPTANTPWLFTSSTDGL